MTFSVKSQKKWKNILSHTKEVKLAGGRLQRIYYFAGTEGPNTLDALPEGFEVMENSRTGLPMLRRKR